MEKKYSVLMSVYYKENPDWFDKSIQSMYNQTVKPSEFVLVEDGPLTKELYDVVEKYKNEYRDHFKVIPIENNGGLGPALKIGIENCSNEYIARMDSDDYSSPTRIEKEFELFEKYPELDIIGTNVYEFNESINNIICKVILPETNEEILKFSKRRCPFRHPSIMYKKSSVIQAGNYREYYLCEDYDLWIRMIRNGCKCYNIQDVLTYMRIGNDFYRRRGGYKYFKSIKKFMKEQLKSGYLTKIEYLKAIIPHAIVSFMPNFLRDFIYKKFLRRGIK